MKLNTCPHCGANLDPCERCDCMEQAFQGLQLGITSVIYHEKDGIGGVDKDDQDFWKK